MGGYRPQSVNPCRQGGSYFSEGRFGPTSGWPTTRAELAFGTSVVRTFCVNLTALPNFRMAQVYRPTLIVERRATNGAHPCCSRSKLPARVSAAARLRQSVSPCGSSLDSRRAWCKKEPAATRRKQLFEHERGQGLDCKVRDPAASRLLIV